MALYVWFSVVILQGVTPPKNDGFSLASGDFPTLGSGKENSGRNADTQGFA